MISIPPDSPFTIDNIPYGVIKTVDNPTPRCATAIGSSVLDLSKFAHSGAFEDLDTEGQLDGALSSATLNAFAALPKKLRRAVRERIQDHIRKDTLDSACLVPMEDVTMLLPMEIGGYSDFYCSLEHCRNCSPLSANTIPKNWFYAPSVYNGRASSVVAAPHPIRRPKGVYYKPGTDKEPVYGPSQALDYELEMGYFVSKEIAYGDTMPIEDAPDHIFGFVILNDWSARDLQVFEMPPLGPFHGKGFGTSISPWIVTLEALEPFRCAPKSRQDPAPFDHLSWKEESVGTWNIRLQVGLVRNKKQHQLATSNLNYLYWTPYQQLTHHAAAGCGLRTGDLCGTGTISGDKVGDGGEKIELGCLYEFNQASTEPKKLGGDTSLTYLEDGDEIIMEAFCGNEGGPRIGFGPCKGVILPAA